MSYPAHVLEKIMKDPILKKRHLKEEQSKADKAAKKGGENGSKGNK